LRGKKSISELPSRIFELKLPHPNYDLSLHDMRFEKVPLNPSQTTFLATKQ
jgi:hypothetical protein